MGRVLRVLLWVAGLPLVALIVIVAMISWQVDRYGQRDQAQPADVIVILGARVDPDGRPGSDLLSRTFRAVDLYLAGYAERLICTGGYAGDRLSAAAVACRFAVQQGVSPGHVWLADGTTDTEGDAAVAARLMQQQGWRTAILVSHPLHLYRAAWHFERHGITVYPSATTTDVARIAAPLRLFYVGRETAAILWHQAMQLGAPRDWEQQFRAWWYGFSRWAFGDVL